jgi:hypothetical protein
MYCKVQLHWQLLLFRVWLLPSMLLLLLLVALPQQLQLLPLLFELLQLRKALYCKVWWQINM